MSDSVRPFLPSAVLVLLILYFGVQALTGERGLLGGAERDRLLAERGRDEGKRQQDEREERNETGHGGGGWIGAGGSGAGGQSSTLDGWGGLERARSGARW